MRLRSVLDFSKNPTRFKPVRKTPITEVQLCSLGCIEMFQKEPESGALALNHGDGATGEEHLCGIERQFIVFLWAC